MSRPRRLPARAALALAIPLAALAGGTALAQQPQYPAARLAVVSPPGARAGTTVEVTLTGSDLQGATGLLFSPPGPRAERLPDPPPPAGSKTPPPPPPRFRVTVPADAEPGIRDVRLVGEWGVSNPRAFVIGTDDEAEEKEPNNDTPQAQPLPAGTVVNGTIASATDVDFFVIAGKRGQRVLLHCAASAIDSRLQPFLQLFDASGRELAADRRYRDRDALLDCVLPADGDYHVRLCDFAYQTGGPESFYRLRFVAGPWVDAAWPPIVEPGKPSEVTLYGRNLPGGKPSDLTSTSGAALDRLTVPVTPPGSGVAGNFPARLLPPLASSDGFGHRLSGSNPIWLGLASGPVVLETGDNDTPDHAQAVPFPCNLCGRLEKPRDRDWYAFDGRAGEVIVAEGFADRLRAPTDLVLEVRRAEDGSSLGEFDTHPDLPDVAGRFFTHTDDPLARFKVPADGRYLLLVRARGGAVAGPRHVYTVALRHEAPDFRLLIVGNHDTGAGLTLRRGSSQEVQVVCFRRDGFDGPVTLAAEGLPRGVTCVPQVLGPGARQGALVLTAAADAPDWAGEFRVTGTAPLGGKEVTREARPGCLVFPPANGNQPTVSRLARAACLAVRGPGPFSLEAAGENLAVPVGGTVSVRLTAHAGTGFKDKVAVELTAGPARKDGKPVPGPKLALDAGKQTEVKLTVPADALPGTSTLVFRGTGKVTVDDPAGGKKRSTTFSAAAPPVRLTVFDSPGELTVARPELEVRPGSEATVTVRLKRQPGFAGEVRLELVPPGGTQGVSATPINLPAGANEAGLVVKAEKGARPGPPAEYVVRATAKAGTATLKSEARVAVRVGDGPAGPGRKEQEVLAAGSAGWRYAAKVEGNGWVAPDFDDKAWREARTPLGNGEPEVTARKGTEVAEKGQDLFCRRAFDVPAELLKRPGAEFRLRVASDNSATVYLNGKPADDEDTDHEFAYWNREVVLPAALLKPGRNVVAVRVRNSAGSSDAYLDLAIVASFPAAAPGK